MKNGIALLLVICLMVTALLLASCAPAPAPAPTPTPTATPTASPTPTPEKEMLKDSLGRLVEKPQYGGVLTIVLESLPTGFDEGKGALGSQAYGVKLTNQELLEGDWTKGPSGTGETNWSLNTIPPLNQWKGCLAESWELADPNTFIFHIRKGIHFALDPKSEASRLVNGREMDANDVVYSLKRNFETPGAYMYGYYPTPGNRPVSITAPDKWTVVVKVPENQAGTLLEGIGDYTRVVAHEVIEKYGDMQDWRNVVGTGPFILTDYIAQSSLTYRKNPNYWGKDPLLPQNQLPYLDGVKMAIIPDISTKLAALRTGKVDWVTDVSWENEVALRRGTPELMETRNIRYAPFLIYTRVDKPELPFYNIKVRRALSMAIDFRAIVKDYFGGNAEVLAHPILPEAEFRDMYTPLEKLPPETRELFEYNPDKAKQLLAEAGYPKGFETEVVCYQELVDRLAIIKAYWADIGVDLKLDVKEMTVFTSIFQAKTHKQMLMRNKNASLPFQLLGERVGNTFNVSMINDPRIEQAYDELNKNYFNESVQRPLMKEISLYILSQSWYIQFPAEYTYCMWHPWLKGYHGELEVGRANRYVWPMYVWLDQQLREEMTGRK